MIPLTQAPSTSGWCEAGQEAPIAHRKIYDKGIVYLNDDVPDRYKTQVMQEMVRCT
jgi:hypothetical protein